MSYVAPHLSSNNLSLVVLVQKYPQSALADIFGVGIPSEETSNRYLLVVEQLSCFTIPLAHEKASSLGTRFSIDKSLRICLK